MSFVRTNRDEWPDVFRFGPQTHPTSAATPYAMTPDYPHPTPLKYSSEDQPCSLRNVPKSQDRKTPNVIPLQHKSNPTQNPAWRPYLATSTAPLTRRPATARMADPVDPDAMADATSWDTLDSSWVSPNETFTKEAKPKRKKAVNRRMIQQPLKSQKASEIGSDSQKAQNGLDQTQGHKLKPMKLQFYRTKMCPWVIASGRCRKDSTCHYAHSPEELRPLPDLSKTKICEEFMKTGRCSNVERCKYAHSQEELRATQSFVKTKLCTAWQEGNCVAGASCRFAHGEDELRFLRPNPQSQPATPPQGPFSSVPSINVSYWDSQHSGSNVESTRASHWPSPSDSPGENSTHQQQQSAHRTAARNNAFVCLASQWATEEKNTTSTSQLRKDTEDNWNQQQHQQQQQQHTPCDSPSTPEVTPAGEATRFPSHLLPSGIFTPVTARCATDHPPILDPIDAVQDRITCDSPWSKNSMTPGSEPPQVGLSPPLYYATAVPFYTSSMAPGVMPNLMFPSSTTYPIGGGPTQPPISGQNIMLPSMSLRPSPTASPVSLVSASQPWPTGGQLLPLPVLQSPISNSIAPATQASTELPAFPTTSGLTSGGPPQCGHPRTFSWGSTLFTEYSAMGGTPATTAAFCAQTMSVTSQGQREPSLDGPQQKTEPPTL